MFSHLRASFPLLRVFLAGGLTAPRAHWSVLWAGVGAVVMQAGDEGSAEQIQSLAQQVGYSL